MSFYLHIWLVTRPPAPRWQICKALCSGILVYGLHLIQGINLLLF